MSDIQPTNQELLNGIQMLQGSIERLESSSSVMQGSINTLHDDVQDALEAIHDLSSHVDEKFSNTDDKFSKIEDRFSKIDDRFSKMDGRLVSLEGFVRTQMITKSYLDDKLASKLGDYLIIDKKQEAKINAFAGKLKDKNILTHQEANEIISMGAFPVPPAIQKT
jgi:vacuolar-type H+-ATPase subunit I/STV1